MKSYFFYLCIVLASIVIVASESCTYSMDCSTFALCRNRECTCMSGYEIDSYRNGKIYCTISSDVYIVPIVIPLVVTGIVAITVSIIIYCILKRRRLARAGQATVWVHSPQVAMGVPVAITQAYPTAYPPPNQQVHPSGYQGYQPNQPVNSVGQTGGQIYPKYPQPNQPMGPAGQINQGHTQPT